ncbi:hypothetical protein M408DRAFT_29449 [Serendipita vermifera MAFF 305830]|uniref:Uncharacterized protein n=1 Tax=Serendipita vermifera MAFF 305830 TaxID=933852 RepID=A0A0C3AQS2_SERVB|nr:hypothetical protein M408DRAFT_29449 [Serendipita vermifera MAFF 305830]
MSSVILTPPSGKHVADDFRRNKSHVYSPQHRADVFLSDEATPLDARIQELTKPPTVVSPTGVFISMSPKLLIRLGPSSRPQWVRHSCPQRVRHLVPTASSPP